MECGVTAPGRKWQSILFVLVFSLFFFPYSTSSTASARRRPFQDSEEIRRQYDLAVMQSKRGMARR